MQRISSTLSSKSCTFPEFPCLEQNKNPVFTEQLRPINKRPSVSLSKTKMISFSRYVLIITIIQLMLGWSGIVQCQTGDGSQKVEQQIQCYACGLPKVHPENDITGSYGKKIYNHSCDDLTKHLKRGSGNKDDYESKFIRTCPVGIKSCFGAKGLYDRDDAKLTNDISVKFFGCSEAKHKHDYGCDEEDQRMDVKDKNNKLVQIEIKVNLCFCSKHVCNHPEGEMFNGATQSSLHDRFSKMMIMTMTTFWLTRVTKIFDS